MIRSLRLPLYASFFHFDTRELALSGWLAVALKSFSPWINIRTACRNEYVNALFNVRGRHSLRSFDILDGYLSIQVEHFIHMPVAGAHYQLKHSLSDHMRHTSRGRYIQLLQDHYSRLLRCVNFCICSYHLLRFCDILCLCLK